MYWPNRIDSDQGNSQTVLDQLIEGRGRQNATLTDLERSAKEAFYWLEEEVYNNHKEEKKDLFGRLNHLDTWGNFTQAVGYDYLVGPLKSLTGEFSSMDSFGKELVKAISFVEEQLKLLSTAKRPGNYDQRKGKIREGFFASIPQRLKATPAPKYRVKGIHMTSYGPRGFYGSGVDKNKGIIHKGFTGNSRNQNFRIKTSRNGKDLKESLSIEGLKILKKKFH